MIICLTGDWKWCLKLSGGKSFDLVVSGWLRSRTCYRILAFHSRLPFCRHTPPYPSHDTRHVACDEWNALASWSSTAGSDHISLRGFCQISVRIFLHPHTRPRLAFNIGEKPFLWKDGPPSTIHSRGTEGIIRFASFFTCQCLLSHAAVYVCFSPPAAPSLFSLSDSGCFSF